MKQEISNQQALIALHNASKSAPLTADQHAFLFECAKQLEAFLLPKPVEEVETKK